MKHFISIEDFSSEEIKALLNNALALKQDLKSNTPHPHLAGKTLTMIFQKASNRTRLSFEIGMFQLGGHAVYVNGQEIQMGVRESIPDIARTMSRYTDLIMIRAQKHSDIVEFAEHATVPVINGLSDHTHPCQAVADTLTILEHKKQLEGCKIAYIGDSNNVSSSLENISEKTGMKITLCSPEKYLPQNAGPATTLCTDPAEALENADVVYTDVWTSMGQEEEAAQRLADFQGYTVDTAVMAKAKADAIFMHCLPAHRGEEVSNELIESPQSKVFDQAENRLHAQKAIMTQLGATS